MDKPKQQWSKPRWCWATKQDLERLQLVVVDALAAMEKRIMATLKDLDDEIAGELTTAVNAIVAAVTALEGKIAAGVDTSSEIASLKTLAANLQAAVATVPPAK